MMSVAEIGAMLSCGVIFAVFFVLGQDIFPDPVLRPFGDNGLHSVVEKPTGRAVENGYGIDDMLVFLFDFDHVVFAYPAYSCEGHWNVP